MNGRQQNNFKGEIEMGKTFKDELSPNFLKQDGASIYVCLGGSGLGAGLYMQPYDEHENEIDSASVFIQSKKRVTELRDLLNEILESGELIDDMEE